MNEKIKPFKDRLKQALEIRELRPVDLCRKTKISQSTMSQYLSGYAEPKKERLTRLATALDVNPTWLMGLDVTMDNSSHTWDEALKEDFERINIFEAELKTLGWEYELHGCYGWYQAHELGLKLDNEGNFSDSGTNEWLGCSDKECASCPEREAYYLFSNGQISFKVTLDDYNLFLNDSQEFFKKRLETLLKKSMTQLFTNNNLSILPAAAHSRTDVEHTAEGQKHDTSIMDDDSEWK
ncbi:helix-turn-helix domain-containing protein [Clostridiaceae bacterium OM08-6BH]|nr:helix-turn-helix domain-containing protein [Clostridiaceae bacterium OM08-6BH]